MKLKRALGFIAAFILIFTAFVFSAVADSEVRQTHGEIEFIAGAGPIAPLDPDFPDNYLVNPNDVNTTDDGDSLSLNVVPDFVFAQADGTAFPARTVGEKIYTLYSPRRPYVQVSDLRGSGGGWKLSVSASQLLMDGAPALDGAKIRLFGGTSRSSNTGLSPLAVNSPIIIECTGQTAAPVTVVDALGDSGSMGAWIIRWYPLDGQGLFTTSTPAQIAGVDLYIPAGTPVLAGSYSATLYWTLSDTV